MTHEEKTQAMMLSALTGAMGAQLDSMDDLADELQEAGLEKEAKLLRLHARSCLAIAEGCAKKARALLGL
jgi:hypothetical protein